ncbi:D-glucuronyl C5-epimerase family protein, partial [Candidatus Bathyarchaeota archaeon]|nr:D-glucuronyl C5-epimerase family protein [Candidatus Bathyarchaeota archaeon]
TMKNNLANAYYVSKDGKVEGPDEAFMRGTFPAAFAIEFLCEAYSNTQFSSRQVAILAKIVSLADWLLTQQCVNDTKKAYGGFKNGESSTEYWSIDAGRAIPALLKAYELTNDADYLGGAKLAGGTFLYNMQYQPAVLGVHDRIYGGFAKFVDIDDDWSQEMQIEDLYDLIGLKMLADTYDVGSKTKYETMMSDAVGFLRDGFEDFYLWFDPKPTGDGKWHRVGVNETEIYDDPFSFALLGLYTYEAWSLTCQKVYAFLQGIKGSAQYLGYDPSICWPGYMDVVSRFAACPYYDAITSGILSSIRRERDRPAYKFSVLVIGKYQDEFLFWGPVFTDYSPITAQKAMANVTWLGRFFLNYEEPLTSFTRILSSHGETVELYPIREAAETVSYGEPLELSATVSPMKIEEVLIEPGYYLNDYIAIYTFAPVRHHDKVRRKGEDYELQSVQTFTFQNETIYFKSIGRRFVA